ncbi:hypothetical protein BHE74_00020429 [Ensete ventricosum]|nr:hypothetical protein BHE74_00020429 [Ensete ventricosum]
MRTVTSPVVVSFSLPKLPWWSKSQLLAFSHPIATRLWITAVGGPNPRRRRRCRRRTTTPNPTSTAHRCRSRSRSITFPTQSVTPPTTIPILILILILTPTLILLAILRTQSDLTPMPVTTGSPPIPLSIASTQPVVCTTAFTRRPTLIPDKKARRKFPGPATARSPQIPMPSASTLLVVRTRAFTRHPTHITEEKVRRGFPGCRTTTTVVAVANNMVSWWRRFIHSPALILSVIALFPLLSWDATCPQGQPQFSTELEQPISSHMQSPDWNMAMHPTSKLTKKRTQKWTTKVVQSAYCEICKINCDTQEVLTIHKQGKKHQKNLQKLQESITAKEKQEPVATVEKETSVAEEEKSVGEQQKRKRGALATTEELEEKKRRVLEGGAAAEEVKVCTLCNVVVNSQKVYEYHIAGQKHAAMVKKQEEAKPAAESQSHLCSEEETFTQSPRCTE